MALVTSGCRGCYAGGTCSVDFSPYSQLSNPVFINTNSSCQYSGNCTGLDCQCVWYAKERILQLTGRDFSGTGNGNMWVYNLGNQGYKTWSYASEALADKGTLAGLIVSCGRIGTCFGGNSNHVAICEGWDPET